MAASQELIHRVATHLEQYMKRYDGSHDFHHLQRVLGLAHNIHDQIKASAVTSSTPQPALDPTIITLSALLHDVGDRKYLAPSEDPLVMVRDLLLSLGADEALANKIQTICSGVSWTTEKKDVAHVQRLIAEHPELAVVQDADRLDALGAVGVGRVFTYGGALKEPESRDMEASMKMFEYKLFETEALMKTEPGKQIAKERSEILRTFRKMWDDEVKVEDVGMAILSVAKAGSAADA